MARRKQTKGACVYCQREMTKSGLTKHFHSCKKRDEAIASAHGKDETLYHLLVEDRWSGVFWLHLEMSGSEPIEFLDRYLRAIWLECCGHMSQFCRSWRDFEEIPMDSKLGDVIEAGEMLCHQYDFGTTSETSIKCLGIRQGKPTSKHPIALLARNEMPEVECSECDRPATKLCQECMHEGNAYLFCDAHAESHGCSEYGGLIPLVNSPRLGMCGYDGPAEPPYTD